MFVIAVTGGIGSGKTMACGYFRSKGAVVLDLDAIAHRLLRPGSETYDRVVEAFGVDIVGDDSKIDRAALARAAFSSPGSCARLNEIVHPAVMKEVLPSLVDLRLLSEPPSTVVLEVPLLVEAPAFGESADVVLAISAAEDARLRRSVADGLSEDDARARLACQASDAEREALADYVIVNEGTADEFMQALERFWDEVVAPSAA